MTFKASPLFLFCLAFPSALQAVPVLTGVGANTWLNAVSADGSTACGASGTPSTYTAIRWRPATGSVVLNTSWGGVKKEAFALSGDGSVVVGSGTYSDGYLAIKWNAAGTATAIPHLPVSPVNKSSAATGVSANGTIVVGKSYTTVGVRSFKWTSGDPTSLNDTTYWSEALGISGDGNTIVGFRLYSSPLSQQATYKRGNNATVDLGDLEGGSIFSNATACNTDGTVIVGLGTIAGEKTRGFRWSTTTPMTLLDALPPSVPSYTIESSALAVSGNGEITVGVSFVNQPGVDDGSTPGGGGGTPAPIRTETATVWFNNSGTPQSLQSLLTTKNIATPGWTFQRISGISSSGNVIVGHGTKDGVRQGFVITNALELFAETVLPIPQLTITRSGLRPMVSFTTQPGFIYKIERSADLTSGSWVGYESSYNTTSDTGPVLRNFTDFSVDLTNPNPPQFFYRIRVKTP